MNTQMVVFESLDLPVLEADEKVWFRATEVCQVLEFSNSMRTIKEYCKEWQYKEWQVGKGRPALYITEAGLYRLILRSKAPVAIKFQDWVTEEVLPAIRRDGAYVSPDATNEQLEALKKKTAALQKERDKDKAELSQIRKERQLASLERWEMAIASRDIETIEAFRIQAGQGRLTALQKQAILRGEWRA